MKLKLKTMAAIGIAVAIGIGLLYFSFRESSNVALAKTALQSVLKDPSSIEYKNIREYYPASVCGEYNAKNGMGGYTGFEFFLFEADKGRLEISPIPGRIQAVCGNSRKEGAEFEEKLRKADGR